jgi:GNAT superfamily N-acetyltransferase
VALSAWLTAAGLRPYNRWAKLVRGVEDPPEAPTDLRIERIAESSAPAFADVLARGFSWPGWVGRWIANTIGRPGWLHYLAYDDGVPVATAALFHEGAHAWLSWAATLPDYRRHGAHAALLARRILDARECGCSLLTMETAEHTLTRPSVAHQNVIRAGFRVAYLRPNFLRDLTSSTIRR